MNLCLLDASPVIAYLDDSDPFHDFVKPRLDRLGGRFVTTSAVVTEAMHFLRVDVRGLDLLVDFLESSGTKVVDCCQPNELKRAVRLMQKYADTPMDFADASLVVLADAVHEYKICTLDRRGFSIFRTAAGKRFHLVMDEA